VYRKIRTISYITHFSLPAGFIAGDNPLLALAAVSVYNLLNWFSVFSLVILFGFGSQFSAPSNANLPESAGTNLISGYLVEHHYRESRPSFG
jgi:hypothetical protein